MMGKFFFAVAVVFVASLVLVETLICNKCTFSLVGKCFNMVNDTCTSNSSVCYAAVINFPFLPDFMDINTQGCRSNTTDCDSIIPSTVLGAIYNTKVNCCSTDSCNPITLSGAPSTRITFVEAAAAAIMVTMMGSFV